MKQFLSKHTLSVTGGSGKKTQRELDRNPLETMNRWKYTTLYGEVLKVQNVCGEALQRWHYRPVKTELDLPEFNFVQEFYTFD